MSAEPRPSAASAAPLPDPDGYLSGESGNVVGRRLAVTRAAADWGCDLAALTALHGPRLDRLADAQRPRRVTVLSVYRSGSMLPRAVQRMRSERHQVAFALGSTGVVDPPLAADTVLTGLTGGKFENLNLLLGALPTTAADPDWLVVVDDDVELGPRFLDRCVALCDRLALDLAQPAQTWRSHAAWRVTRRRPAAVARRTAFVEIGPVTVFARRAASELTPFPPLRFGWGLDSHWAAVARDRGWRVGILDALAVRHAERQVAVDYPRGEAVEESRRFLVGRRYLPKVEAQRVYETFRRVPR